MKCKGILAMLSFAAALGAAAESPYGTAVVECESYVTGRYSAMFNAPSSVLGEPTRLVNIYGGSWDGVGYSSRYGGVAHPAVPAYAGGLFLSLEAGGDSDVGFVVIAFDHDVIDDPDNPFGVDFIVFGNAGCTATSQTGLTADLDPTTCRLKNVGFPEESVVEVAQYPGGPWYGSDKWRTSDGFAPTLGHVYDPANADTNLYSGNLWWGAKTDATYPVDPRIDFSDCAGLTLAELCQRYNGSAGGTGYDLAHAVDENGNELPADAAHGGHKWFRYVRISSTDSDTPNEEGDYVSIPEVDAVADVAPVSGYRQWVLANFSWDEAWQTNLTAATAIAPNGLPNGLNCVFGLKRTDAVESNVPFEIAAFEHGETAHVIKMRSPTQLTTAPKGLVVKEAAVLNGEWTTVRPTFVSAQPDGDAWLNTFTVPKDAAARFFKLALDTE